MSKVLTTVFHRLGILRLSIELCELVFSFIASVPSVCVCVWDEQSKQTDQRQDY